MKMRRYQKKWPIWKPNKQVTNFDDSFGTKEIEIKKCLHLTWKGNFRNQEWFEEFTDWNE